MDEDTFTLTIEAQEYVGLDLAEDTPAAGPVEATEDTGPQLVADIFVLPLLEFGFEETPEPGYYLYWYGDGNTAYWLSDQPIPDFNGVLVAGGDALYAKFGVLGTYMDMDLAMGYGGIRPTEHVYNLESHIQNDVVPLA